VTQVLCSSGVVFLARNDLGSALHDTGVCGTGTIWAGTSLITSTGTSLITSTGTSLTTSTVFGKSVTWPSPALVWMLFAR